MSGEVLEVGAWGLGHALKDTHCDTSYGLEGKNNTLDTPQEIWQDLVTNYINKSFGGSATNYAVTTTKIANIHSDFSVTYLGGKLQSNFDMVCRLCDLVSAHAQGEHSPAQDGCHWFVDEDSNLFINTIGAHENNASGWPTYWKSSQAASTLTVTEDMVLYNFDKNLMEYANHVLLYGPLRKPAFDYWTERAAADSLWDVTQDGGADTIAVTDDTTPFGSTARVGSNALQAQLINSKTDGYFFYPASAWNLDLTKIGSENTLPRLRFSIAKDQARISNIIIHLGTGTGVTDCYYHTLTTAVSAVDKWFEFDLPVGTYYDSDLATRDALGTWSVNGSPDWADIDYIKFRLSSTTTGDSVWVDDLHFYCDCMCRAAKLSTISPEEYQKVVKCDVALDDTMKEGTPGTTDTGTIARLAYAELMRRQKQPIVGVIQTPLAIDALPGQLVHTHACEQSSGSYRIDKDMRVVELRHIFDNQGARTLWNLTDDVDNSFAFGAPTGASLLHDLAGALGHKEAKDLKGGTIDPLVYKLTESY